MTPTPPRSRRALQDTAGLAWAPDRAVAEHMLAVPLLGEHRAVEGAVLDAALPYFDANDFGGAARAVVYAVARAKQRLEPTFSPKLAPVPQPRSGGRESFMSRTASWGVPLALVVLAAAWLLRFARAIVRRLRRSARAGAPSAIGITIALAGCRGTDALPRAATEGPDEVAAVLARDASARRTRRTGRRRSTSQHGGPARRARGCSRRRRRSAMRWRVPVVGRRCTMPWSRGTRRPSGRSSQPGSTPTRALVASAGSATDELDVRAETALDVALRYHADRAAEVLLVAGAVAHSAPPLHEAARMDDVERATRLVTFGVELSRLFEGRTAGEVARGQRSERVAAVLGK